MLIDIHLGNNAEFTLTFRFHDNPVAAKFYQRMKLQKNEIINRQQFYNFGETIEDVSIRLSNIVNRIKELSPDLLQSDSVYELNKLHINFPKHQQSASGELLDVLRDFNYTIHHLENKQSKSNDPAFLFACEDPGEPLMDSAYELFTISKKFGEMYMPYPHVGKHLFEMFLDYDVAIPASQIVCTNKMCNGGYVWLGKDRYVDSNIKIMRQIYNFYKLVKHKMPYSWGDPKLALGYLPLASLESTLSQEQIIFNVSKYKFLHSWSLR